MTALTPTVERTSRPAQTDQLAATSPEPRRGRILIVDDSAMMRKMLAAHLARVGYTDIQMADSGASALAILGLEGDCRSEEVDVILMDLHLPDTDGIAIIRTIKARPELQKIPILMVTASQEVETLRQAFEEGASDYITKPFNEIALIARVGAALRLKREIDQREALHRQLEQLSLTDGLTGVANRRHFDRALRTEWNRAARTGSPLALILIDIDHFKRFNDTYGHQEGDRCLQRVAGALARAGQRPGDLLARYGGEEFALILPETDLAGARAAGERLLEAVAALAIPHAASSAGSTVSLSAGLAVASASAGGEPDMLIAAADRALYGAKEQGRNRLVAAQE